MKNHLAFIILFSLLVMPLNGQSEIESIKSTLNQYIEGTAIGSQDLLRKAFHDDFNLFLIAADKLRVIKGSDYIARIENGKPYNRIAQIISIDQEHDTAIGKIEVYFPDRKQVATDYLLLLKENESWKIVHKIIDLKSIDIGEELPDDETNNLPKLNETLLNYIEGTANSDVARITSAFEEGFNLYYVKNDKTTILTGKNYLKNFTEGKKNNRIGKVVVIDFEDTAAYAKVEVRMPEHNRRVMDYLLLLKIKGEWRIIHKSFTTNNY
ncbi:MAG: nuclear transport factor 2 family protein [Bacteroidota bacterium]